MKRRRIAPSHTLLILDEAMVLSTATVLGMSQYPAEILLDFLWLLFTSASLAMNVDGFVSPCPLNSVVLIQCSCTKPAPSYTLREAFLLLRLLR